MIGVLVVDDDPLVRSALGLMLGGQPDVRVVGEAADGRAGLDAARELRPDVVLMDIRMPVLDGLAATIELRRSPDPPHVIVLTTFDADDYVLRALAAGADGFLLKDTPPPEILEAIRRVADGDPMLSPSVTRSLIKQVAPPGQLTHDPGTGAAGLPDRARARRRPRGRARAQQRRHRRRALPVGARPSRRTCPGCSRSSRSPTGCRSRSWSTTPGWSDRSESDSDVVRRARHREVSVTVVRRSPPRRACRPRRTTAARGSARAAGTPLRAATSPASRPVRCRSSGLSSPCTERRLGQQQADARRRAGRGPAHGPVSPE